MTEVSWKAFRRIRREYKNYVKTLAASLPALEEAQRQLIARRSGASYPLETPVVYNEALDDISAGSDIRLIMVADNPGRREQAAEKRRYLVGPSGKIAEGFFRNHPELRIDFRQNVIILNKTPIHTPRTVELKELAKLGGPEIAAGIEESQKRLAEINYAFHQALGPVPLWVIGYSEMRKRGIFEAYTERMKELYHADAPLREQLFFYRHFSMNQFTIDLNKERKTGKDAGDGGTECSPESAAPATAACLKRMGRAYRRRILGW